ncbi:exonuclease domain-containing protein [Sulfobacillus thermosulfidooxidans]|uniref:exonuclease domain-containing protein n=1 Tax=Sulfobacillus thermosulfidooxidans TaxID=28034 RepID=UPI0002E257C8|nr:exonuclease domain-containing protein [Sulfobacillus thermosulfidooxidans]
MYSAIFVDVETTGLKPGYDEIIEIAFVAFDCNETGEDVRITYTYHSFREPRVPISSSAQKIHHITQEMIVGRVVHESELTAFLRGVDFFIAHNAQFDRAFLARLIPEVNCRPWLCSMRGINWSHWGFRYRNLQYLLDVHGIAREQKHRALADAMAGVHLLQRQSPEGRVYLAYLVEAWRTRLHPVD